MSRPLILTMKTFQRPHCQILSFDYLDFDVLINVRMFYRLAGYGICSSIDESSLIVILRGYPPRSYPEYTKEVHIYDYVKENQINYKEFFPSASSIIYISVDTSSAFHLYDTLVQRYLPVFPQIWSDEKSHSLQKSILPLHIGNLKPLSNDSYQSQLIELANSKYFRVYGDKWFKVFIQTKALSYFSANKILSRSSFCFGLMYPYQRGRSLSGRMWQAPINGCFVISELDTNIFHCPGVIEVSHYSQNFSYLYSHTTELAADACNFWNQQTSALAADLNLSLNYRLYRYELLRARISLLLQHLHFFWLYHIPVFFARVRKLLSLTRRSLLSLFR